MVILDEIDDVVDEDDGVAEEGEVGDILHQQIHAMSTTFNACNPVRLSTGSKIFWEGRPAPKLLYDTAKCSKNMIEN